MTTDEQIARYERMVYPYVGITNDGLCQVVLFTGPSTGVNINGKGWPLGHRSEGWAEADFVPYYGNIGYANGRPASTDTHVHSVDKWATTEGALR